MSRQRYGCRRLEDPTRDYYKEAKEKELCEEAEEFNRVKKNYVVRDELLWNGDQVVGCIEGDQLARKCGFVYIEQLIRALKQSEK